MELDNSVEKYKNIYECIHEFIESDDEKEIDTSFNNLVNIIDENKSDEVTREVFLIISIISNNHHFDTGLFDKIKKILSHYSVQIRQVYSNYELFDLFKGNKRVLLFLFKSKIIDLEKSIIDFLSNQIYDYGVYFYPEIKDYISESKSKSILECATEYDSDIFNDNFDQKRETGENDNYIAQMIQTDSVEDFIQYVNRYNIPLNSNIKSSVFESNLFLIDKDTELIEYATFCGAIQIIRYLVFNDVEIPQSIWLYAIRSNNAEIIHYFEENDIPLHKDSLKEAVECHHNNVGYYLINNSMIFKDLYISNVNIDANIASYSLEFHNYSFYQKDADGYYMFFYFCKFNYIEFAKLYLKHNKLNCHYLYNGFISPLKIAAQRNYQEIVRLLLESDHFEINEEAFCGCKSLTNDAIPSTLRLNWFPNKELPKNCFSSCSSLTRLSIPDGIVQIGHDAINKCESLTEITIPSSVVFIDIGAFFGCSKLKTINLPQNISIINKDCFMLCTSLTQINIPSSVTKIEAHAFCECRSLQQIRIPSSVTSIENDSFDGCTSLDDIQFDLPYNVKTDFSVYCATTKHLTICCSIACIEKKYSNLIGEIKKVTLAPNVKAIKKGCFCDCKYLTEIENLSNSLTSIEDCAFSNCSSIKEYSIPSTVTIIKPSTFSGCKSLFHMVIPSTITSICSNAFEGCINLGKIEIPNSTSLTGNNIFNGCSSLIEIIVPSSTKEIGDYCFSNCSSLTRIVLPSSLKSIGSHSFDSCTSLNKIEIPSSVESIGSFAFFRCTSVVEITISESVKKIDESTFDQCTSLKNIQIPPSVTEIGYYAFNDCKAIEYISIPESVEFIEDYAFQGCSSLKQIIIPSSIDDIDILGLGPNVEVKII